MSLIYIAGLSGSGKSTLVKELNKRGLEAYDADVELCGWYDNKTHKSVLYPRKKEERPLDWQEHHSFLISEKQVKELAEKADQTYIFICGIAPNDLEVARKYFDKVLFLHISKETMINRVTSRTNNIYGHDTDQLAVIVKWYTPTIDKYKAYGANFIDAEQSMDKIYTDIIKYVSA
jgi:adenylate kinase family enzyme